MKKSNYFDDTSKVSGHGFTRWNPFIDNYDSGLKITPHGIVDITCEKPGPEFKYSEYTRLDFVYKGRLYMRNFRGQSFNRKKLAQLANEFAREIANRKPRKK
jgi:hypothetical protein